MSIANQKAETIKIMSQIVALWVVSLEVTSWSSGMDHKDWRPGHA